MDANKREFKGKAPSTPTPIGAHSRSFADNPDLFGRVAAILEQARGAVVRAVNTNMVLAYWLIGREIVHDLQAGEERAEYGEKVVEELSARLTVRYGKGFSVPNLKNFRQFYQAYSERVVQIGYPPGSQSEERPIPFPAGRELADEPIPYPTGTKSLGVSIPHPSGVESPIPQKSHPPGDELPQGFSPQLSWSHYRVLMRVDSADARAFYEREAIEGGWDKRTLERQVHTQYYDRCLHSQNPDRMIADGRRLQHTQATASEFLKNPYVLEFLGYPNFAELRETDVEQAIITHLQRFLLELGHGFAFVARQKHIRIEEDDRFIDLVFYHCRMKFYLLIDLKMGKLTHGDVGQMDGYVRMFDGLFAAPDDNPTIGLILCTEKSDTVARYSVLNDRKQIFASKYLPNLPSEEQLSHEIARERRLIEAANQERRELTDGEQS
jgi:predicted nuclease of restriction endonuclease-like (RecB) superfamily